MLLFKICFYVTLKVERMHTFNEIQPNSINATVSANIFSCKKKNTVLHMYFPVLLYTLN